MTEYVERGDSVDVEISLSFESNADEDLRDSDGKFLREEYEGTVSVEVYDDYETESGRGSLTLNVSLNVEYRDGSSDEGMGAAQIPGISLGPQASADEIADIVQEYAEGFAELVGGSKGVVDMSIESAYISYRG